MYLLKPFSLCNPNIKINLRTPAGTARSLDYALAMDRIQVVTALTRGFQLQKYVPNPFRTMSRTPFARPNEEEATKSQTAFREHAGHPGLANAPSRRCLLLVPNLVMFRSWIKITTLRTPPSRAIRCSLHDRGSYMMGSDHVHAMIPQESIPQNIAAFPRLQGHFKHDWSS